MILSGIVLPQFVLPTAKEVAILALMAAAWCGGQWLSVGAYHRGNASALAPFSYSQLLWASVFGYLAFGHIPDALSLIGIVIILASGVVAILRAAHDAAILQPNQTKALWPDTTTQARLGSHQPERRRVSNSLAAGRE